MITHVMGEKIKNTYEVKAEKSARDGKHLRRPKIEKVEEDIKYEEICSYEGAPQSAGIKNFAVFDINTYISISENEKVAVSKEVFRADLGEWFQYVDKVLEEKDVNLTKCEKELKKELAAYNKQMIEDDEKAKAYCDIHKLDYAETDYDELRKIIDRNNISTHSFKSVALDTSNISKPFSIR